jgi:hypothetical protein
VAPAERRRPCVFTSTTAARPPPHGTGYRFRAATLLRNSSVSLPRDRPWLRRSTTEQACRPSSTTDQASRPSLPLSGRLLAELTKALLAGRYRPGRGGGRGRRAGPHVEAGLRKQADKFYYRSGKSAEFCRRASKPTWFHATGRENPQAESGGFRLLTAGGVA